MPMDPHQPISTEGAQHSMFQLRIYTLRSPEALQQYATVHWARHPATSKIFGVTTHGVLDRAKRRRESTRRADPLPTWRRPRTTHAAYHDQPRIRRRPDIILTD